MTDAIYRQWVTLRAIPREPQRANTRTIWSRVKDEGYAVTKRTLERDLAALSIQFGFTSETESLTTYWFWPKDTATLDVPGLDPASALALVLSREHLQPLLPASVLALLAPYFKRAEAVLDEQTGHRLGAWRKKVRTVSRGPQKITPIVAPAVHATVTEALLRELKIKTRYRSRDADSAKELMLNPLGLVARDGMLYLIATAWDYPDAYQYALHRFASAELLEERGIVPKGFKLDRYVGEQAAFSYPLSDKPIQLVADFDSDAAAHLRERPLSRDQVVETVSDTTVRLTAMVTDTAELRWWLCGYGDGVTIIGPSNLRNEFRGMSQRMSQAYRSKKSV